MNFFIPFKASLIAIAQERILPRHPVSDLEKEAVLSKLTCEPPRDPSHGDIATNMALVLSKVLQCSPKACAEEILPFLHTHQDVQKAEVAGPGFINLWLKETFWRQQIRHILEKGVDYGSSRLGQGTHVNVEYVSTNPTGPLHVGHCRGAVFGDALATLLQKVGYKVTKEYYVNDAGAQIDRLAQSLYQRYLEALGHKIPEIEGYPGEYLVPVAQKLVTDEGDRWEREPQEHWLPFFKPYVVNAMMTLIRQDLDRLSIHQDVFTCESDIAASGGIEQALEVLKTQGLLYQGTLEPPKGKPVEDWEPREQLLFRSTAFGDDTDRPVQKSDGTWAYLTPDIAYHYDKFKRGSTVLIDVLGADHAGYVKRLTSAVKAVTQDQATLDIKICQLVKFLEDGVPLKMSKRAGTFIGVQEVLEKVGKDVLRFIMLTRKNDAPLDFDLEKVVEKSKDNPVFYVQYAHARIHSVKRHLKGLFPRMDISSKALKDTPLDFLTSPFELSLIKLLAQWPRQVETAAQMHEPHRLTFYLYDVASSFHALWNKGKEDAVLRFIDEAHEEKTKAKMALLRAVEIVIASGLQIFGVTPLTEM